MGFQTSLSALRAGEQAFGVVGDNLANSSTVGAKASEVKFKGIVSGTANPNSFSAGGVKAMPFRNAGAQGLLKATASEKDIAISGNGFFVVGKLGEVAVNAQNEFAFTRAGSFMPDKQGYLVNSAGFYLQGWRTNTSGVPNATDLNSLNELETIRINQIAGVTTPTSMIELKLNLPSGAAIGNIERTSISTYNSLGEPNTLTLTWTKSSNSPLEYTLDVTTASGAVTQGNTANAYTGIIVRFDGNGQPVSFSGQPTPPDIHIAWANSAALPGHMSLDLGDANTSNGIGCRSGGYSEILTYQDGNGPGQLIGIDINETGIVSALFSNGQSSKMFKIPLANFASPHQLSSKDGNVWGQTDASGGFLLATAKSAGLGAIKSNSLEQSTVELADELTKMMEIGRFYSSNVKVIQADDQMFNDLKTLYR